MVPFVARADSRWDGFIFGPRLSTHLVFKPSGIYGDDTTGSMATGNVQFGAELGCSFNVGNKFYLIPDFTIDYADFLRKKQDDSGMVTDIYNYKVLNPLRFGFHLGFAWGFDNILLDLALGTKIHNSKESTYNNETIDKIKILHMAGFSAELSALYLLGKHVYIKYFIGFDIFFIRKEWEEWVDEQYQLALERGTSEAEAKMQADRQKANLYTMNMGIVIGGRY